MGRQFHIYLLPSDIESLMAELQYRAGLKIIGASAPTSRPIEIASPILKRSPLIRTEESVHAFCYLVPSLDVDIKMQYVAVHNHWIVEDSSEAIQLSGCDFDGKLLVRGRFYFQNDVLLDDWLVSKRRPFLEWADRVYRTAKKALKRSKVLDAYVSAQAESWRREGGRFAALLFPGKTPIYAPEPELSYLK